MNTPHAFKLASVALAFASFGITAVAAASGQQGATGGEAGASFRSMDTNSDGSLSRAEIPAGQTSLRNRFGSYDSNHDGVLDAREFATAHAALQGGGQASGGATEPPRQPYNRTPNHNGG